jgi:rhodopsin domain-containing protein
MSLWTIKISILLLYRRILAYRWAKVLTYVLLAITVLSGLWAVISVLTVCIPLASFWDISVKGFCHGPLWWAPATFTHIITDFLIYILPTPVIWTLRLRFRLKALLYFLFAFGFL